MRTKLSLAALIMIFAGCGGSGSTTSELSITGKVADGYLVGASVFLDKNGNYQLDPGEPFTTSGQNGAYSLKVNPADIGSYPVVAVATKGQTIDLDTGLPVLNSYVLSLPAKAVSGTPGGNFISPLSSQVREVMEARQYANVQPAIDQVIAKMGLPIGTDLLADYQAINNANNTSMHTTAQFIANLMGAQMPSVLGASGTNTTVDVNRYRAMAGMIFGNLSSLRVGDAETVLTNMTNAMNQILNKMPSGQPFRNMSTAFRGRQALPHQILSPSKSFPVGVSTGVYVFRTETEWANFWQGQAPVLPSIDFGSNNIIAVVNVGDTDFEISRLQSWMSGVVVDGIEMFGYGQPPPVGMILIERGPHGPLVATPKFSADAILNITGSYARP